MKNFKRINEAVDIYLREWKGWKIAIYPFGEMGVETKEVLNWRYGIKESIIVDEYLSSVNTDILSLESIENCADYIWFLTCQSVDFHNEILALIKERVPQNQIIDIFEDSISFYSEEYRLLSKIGTKEGRTVSSPSRAFLDLTSMKKSENRVITVAEIGIGWGATAVEVCKRLSSEDTYYCFDYQDMVEDLIYDLGHVPEICCKLIAKGNSRKVGDSYYWNLSELLFQMRNDNKNGMFDVVYLDGTHNFLHDGIACCLLKELIKPNGYFVFDDMFWKAETYLPLYQEWEKLYSEEQLDQCHVQRVVNAFMIGDRRFRRIFLNSFHEYTAIFQKETQNCIYINE